MSLTPSPRAFSSYPFRYIERQADETLYTWLKSGQFCTVLHPPHSGKSSLRMHVTERLRAEKTVCLTIDLQSIAPQHSTMSRYVPHHDSYHHADPQLSRPHQRCPYGQFILSELWRGINGLPADHLSFWLNTYPSDTIAPQLEQLVEELVLAHALKTDIVICVDGLDHHLMHHHSLRELLRFVQACHDRRDGDPMYQQLTFCLLGDANLPLLDRQLNLNLRSICQTVDLPGLRFQDLSCLNARLSAVVDDPDLALRMILQLSQGQPVLTQLLYQLLMYQLRNTAPLHINAPNPDESGSGDPEPDTMGVALSDESTTFDLNHFPQWVQALVLEQEPQQRIHAHTSTTDQPSPFNALHYQIQHHFQQLCDRLFQSEPLWREELQRYQRILQEGDLETTRDEVDTELCLSGLVIERDGRLEIANPIYQDVFNQEWVVKCLNQERSPLSTEFEDETE